MPDDPKPNQIDPAVAQDLARIALALKDNPKTRKDFLKAVKVVEPNFNLPADVAADDVIATVNDKFAERDRKEATAAVNQRLEKQRKGLLDGTLIEGVKYDDETVKKIETFMQAKGIADYDDGARLYASHQPPPAPTPEIPSAGQWELPKVKNPFDTAALAASAKTKAYDAIRELRGQGR